MIEPSVPPSSPAGQVHADLDRLAAGTERLLRTCAALDAAALAAPSHLPGWSRAHVLTHLARNADGLRNVLLGARAGRAVAPYPSPQLREADIEAGAGRPAHLIVLDVGASAERFALDAASTDPALWATDLGLGPGQPQRLADLPGHRLREVEAHHADLDAGYHLADVPADVAASFLDLVPGRFAGSTLDPAVLVATDLGRRWTIGDGAGPTVSGTANALLAWVLGRSGPEGLTADGGQVPPSPGWG